MRSQSEIEKIFKEIGIPEKEWGQEKLLVFPQNQDTEIDDVCITLANNTTPLKEGENA